MDSNVWWISPLVIIVLRILSIEATGSRVTGKDGRLVFRATLGTRLILGGGAVGFLAMILRGIIREEEAWPLWGLGGFALATLVVWPTTIVLDSEGIASYRWWKSRIFIPWGDVTAIDKGADRNYHVYGKYGQQIDFTRYHADPARFSMEVRHRAKLNTVLDASRPPSLRS